MSKLRSSNRRGFTLVELLVVVGVQVALLSFIEQGCLFGELSDAAVGGVGNTDIAANVNGQVFGVQQVINQPAWSCYKNRDSFTQPGLFLVSFLTT